MYLFTAILGTMSVFLRRAYGRVIEMPTTVEVLGWAGGQRAYWRDNLKRLRSGQAGTFELRHQKRVDTTVETIVDLSRRLAELDTLIAKGEADRR